MPLKIIPSMPSKFFTSLYCHYLKFPFPSMPLSLSLFHLQYVPTAEHREALSLAAPTTLIFATLLSQYVPTAAAPSLPGGELEEAADDLEAADSRKGECGARRASSTVGTATTPRCDGRPLATTPWPRAPSLRRLTSKKNETVKMSAGGSKKQQHAGGLLQAPTPAQILCGRAAAPRKPPRCSSIFFLPSFLSLIHSFILFLFEEATPVLAQASTSTSTSKEACVVNVILADLQVVHSFIC